jgi:putative ABC transport system substrate-binding protein
MTVLAGAMPVIGVLWAGSSTSSGPFMAAFLQGLSETGYVEGQNLAIEYRWAEAITIGCPHWPPISSAARSI